MVAGSRRCITPDPKLHIWQEKTSRPLETRTIGSSITQRPSPIPPTPPPPRPSQQGLTKQWENKGSVGWHQDAERHKWKAHTEVNPWVQKNGEKKGGKEDGLGRDGGSKFENERTNKGLVNRGDMARTDGAGKGSRTRKKTKEGTEQVADWEYDGSGFLVPYPPHQKDACGRPGHETLLQQLLGKVRVWPGRWNRVISVHEE